MKRVWLGMAILCGLAAVAPAADTADDLGITVDLSYTSKYIWRGFDVLDDTAAFQPSVNFDLGNGFSANLWMSYAGSGGTTGDGISRVDATEYDYTLAYSSSAFEDCPWKTNYMVGYRYYDYIDTATRDADVMEVFLTGEMPNLIEGGIVPHFGVFQMWPAKGSGANSEYSGTIYLMGFNYGFAFDQMPGLPLTFSWDIVYNDGTGTITGLTNPDHDWSHMVWGLSTAMTCPMTGAKIVPAVYFQNSFDDSVNNEDELWGSISYSFAF